MNLHADDMGLNESANQAIHTMLKKGKLRSVSVLANGQSISGAIRILKKFPKIQIFLHFNLIEGNPIYQVQTNSTLLKQNGKLAARNEQIMKLLLFRMSIHDIEQELIAQIIFLAKNGIKLSGIDSHQHIHALSPVAEIVERVAKQYRIQNIRSFNQMRCQTFIGKSKLYTFKLLAFVTHLLYFREFELPISWRIRKWKDFLVSSWEKVIHQDMNAYVVIHPGTTYDRK